MKLPPNLTNLAIGITLLNISTHAFLIPTITTNRHSLLHPPLPSTSTGEEYSRCLTPSEVDAQKESNPNALSKWQRVVRLPFRFVRKILPRRTPTPGNLILIKCGESEWKQNFTYTGWDDPDLTSQGVKECEHAARLLLESGYDADVIYTSVLKRAIHSVWVILRESNSDFLPVFKSWRLNERMYGSLQGLSKSATAKEFGDKVVQAWRRGFDARPPPVSESDERYPGNQRRYAGLDKDLIPKAESLRDCMERTRPFWENTIQKELKKGSNVMVMAHSNSLRGLAKIIDDIDDEQVRSLSFPPGIPVVYKFDKEMKPLPAKDDNLALKNTSGMFLEKPGLLKEALQREDEWLRSVPGAAAEASNNEFNKRSGTLEESLLKLKEAKEMEQWAKTFITVEDAVKKKIDIVDDDNDDDDEGKFEEDVQKTQETSSSSPSAAPTSPITANMNQFNTKDPVVVFVRHGQTPHNQLALFTGWEDPNLTPKGIDDAKNAGRLLRAHNFQFDVVYTSWLSRAIETAWYIMDELDAAWLPMVKSWRLNERHYGALTGKSKKMVANIYGDEQLIRWRRGYDIPPPEVSSYSFSYPGNDLRKIKYVKDIRLSFTETFCRSVEARRLQLHRKFPKSESLKHCMARTIPFYTEKIVPEAVAKGKRVLITSHENAIRGILMHLCEIPEEHMNGLHLPNGLPLVYNVKRKCISLLDDGSGRDPMEVYDFGSATEFLFKPCELLDEDFEWAEEEKETNVELKSQQGGKKVEDVVEEGTFVKT